MINAFSPQGGRTDGSSEKICRLKTKKTPSANRTGRTATNRRAQNSSARTAKKRRAFFWTRLRCCWRQSCPPSAFTCSCTPPNLRPRAWTASPRCCKNHGAQRGLVYAYAQRAASYRRAVCAEKRYVIGTLAFTVLNSLFLIILRKIGFYQYHTETDRFLPAIFSGIILGARMGMLLRIGMSTGGVDIVACMVQKSRPYLNVEG